MFFYHLCHFFLQRGQGSAIILLEDHFQKAAFSGGPPSYESRSKSPLISVVSWRIFQIWKFSWRLLLATENAVAHPWTRWKTCPNFFTIIFTRKLAGHCMICVATLSVIFRFCLKQLTSEKKFEIWSLRTLQKWWKLLAVFLQKHNQT